MSTNDERAMILKMLQEGKISVEEADSLLDVLSETDSDSTGFAASRDEATPSGEAEETRRTDGTDGTGRTGRRRATFDIDLSGISEGIRAAMASVKESMSGVSESLRDSFDGMGDFSFDFHDGRMGKARAEEERELSLDAAGLSKLSVSCPRGDIRIIGGEAPTIHARSTITAWGEDSSAAQSALEQVELSLVERDGAAVLETDSESPSVRARVDLEITVPRSLSLSVSAVSGDLWIENVAGACAVQTVSGDVSIANVGYEAECHQRIASQSGDINATSVSGTIALSTASGDINVDEFHGDLSAVSKSGEIRILRGDGPASVRSVSGEVQVELVHVDHGELSITNVGGDIRVVLPREASIVMNARTLSGDVNVEGAFPDATRSRGTRRGERNGGRLPLNISTVSGDVEVEVGE